MTARQRYIPTWPGWAALAAGVGFGIAGLLDGGAAWVGLAAVAGLLAGAYWLGLSGWRAAAHGLLLAFTATAIGLRLFSAELITDRSQGVVVTVSPDFATRITEPPSPTPRYVLGPAPADYAGRTVYRAIVRVGWIAAPAAWLLAFATWLPLAGAFNLNVPFPRRRKAARTRRGARKRLVNYGLGYSFIFLGVLGIFLPILQGILFLVIGFLFLARVSPRVRLARARLRRRFPEWAHKYDRVEHQAKDWLHRKFGRGRKAGAKGR
jgi:uncharacterized membrane protein YbaN (DUF454 family)